MFPSVLAALLFAASPAPDFVLGMYATDVECFDTIASLGFNTVLCPSTDEAVDAAGRKNLALIPSYFGDDAAATSQFQKFGGDPRILAWYPYDEPDLNRVSVDAVADRIRHMNAFGRKPIFLTIWNPAAYALFAPLADFFAPVAYPFVGDATELGRVYDLVREARMVAPSKKIFPVLQCFVQRPWFTRAPSALELENMAWQAVIAGADGITWFIYRIKGQDGSIWSLDDKPALRRKLRAINRDIVERNVTGGTPEKSGSIRWRSRTDGKTFTVLIANVSQTPSWLKLKLPSRSLQIKESIRVKSSVRGDSLTITVPPIGTGIVVLQ